MRKGKYIRVSNEIFRFNLGGLTEAQIGLLFTVLWVMSCEHKTHICCSFGLLRKVTGSKASVDTICEMLRVIQTIIPIFSSVQHNRDKRCVHVALKASCSYIIMKLGKTNPYTKIPIEEFLSIKSKNARLIALRLYSFSKNKWWATSIEELCILLGKKKDIPYVYDKSIKPALKLLGKRFENLQCKGLKNEFDKRKIEQFVFTYGSCPAIPTSFEEIEAEVPF